MSIVKQRTSFLASGTYRKTNAFSTCFYTVFLLRDFLSFCTDSLYTCSYSHLFLHNTRLFAEIAYQITQVPRVFDTRFLPFYTTYAIRCTCRKPNKFLAPLPGNFFLFGKLARVQVSILYLLFFDCLFCEYSFIISICLLLLIWITAIFLVLYMHRSSTGNLVPLDLEIEAMLRRNRAERRRKLLQDSCAIRTSFYHAFACRMKF